MLVNNQNRVTPLMTTLNQMCFVKLERNNYLLWSSMVMSVIRGNKLEGFILGTKQRPDMFICENDEEKLNLAFEGWSTVDKLLLGWLYNTISGHRM